MAKADAQVRWFNLSTAEPAVCAPVNLCRQLFLRCVRALSEARSALALRPEHVAVLRCCGVTQAAYQRGTRVHERLTNAGTG